MIRVGEFVRTFVDLGEKVATIDRISLGRYPDAVDVKEAYGGIVAVDFSNGLGARIDAAKLWSTPDENQAMASDRYFLPIYRFAQAVRGKLLGQFGFWLPEGEAIRILGLDKTTIDYIDHGTIPRRETIEHICTILDLDLEHMLSLARHDLEFEYQRNLGVTARDYARQVIEKLDEEI